MPFDLESRARTALDDEASNICQALCVGHGGGLNPPRFLVLVPGKLLVMASSRAAVPLAALSLAEAARVGVRVGAEAGASAEIGLGRYGQAWEAGAGAELAVLEVTVRGRGHVFRMPSTVSPARCCPPRHPTHFEPVFLDLNGTL